MFRAPLCPSSRAYDTPTNTKTYTDPTSYIFTEPDGLCGNQRYRRELLMMGIMVPETC